MAFCGYLKIDTAVDILLGPFMDDGDGDTADTDAVIDVELSKNGQALADSASAAPSHDAAGDVDGYYNCILASGDVDTLGILTVVAHHADDLPVRQDYQVVTANWFDTMCSTDNLDVNVTATSATALDAVLKGSTFALAMADAIWDEVLTGLTHNENTSAGKRLREVEDTAHIYSGGVASATASTVVLDAGPVTTDGYYDHDLIIVIAGTGVGQSRHIDSYTQGDLTFNIIPDWKITPAADSEVAIRADGEVDVHGFSADGLGEIEAECVDALESFNLDKLLAVSTAINADSNLDSIVVDKSVMSHLMTPAADTSTYQASTDSIEAIRNHIGDGTNLTEAGGTGNHLTAIDLPNQTMDISGNLSGSVGSVTGDIGGKVTGNVDGTVAGKTPAEAGDAMTLAADAVDATSVHSNALDAIVMKDLAAGNPSATAGIVTAINYLYEAWRNVSETTATLHTIMKDDGTTPLVKIVIGDDDTTFDKAEFVDGT